MTKITHSYVFDKNIFLSPESINHNPHTWGRGIWQKNVIEYFYNLIEDETCVVDIGAQSGAFSLLAKYFPYTEFHCFEPDPTNFSLLEKNIALNELSNIAAYQLALSNTIGPQILNTNISHSGLHTLGKSPNFGSNPIEVHTSTLDDFFEDKKVDLIKIDTEGGEYNILKGGIDLITTYKPKILLEYHEGNLSQFNISLQDLNELIESIGYKIEWLYEDNALIIPK